VFTATGAATGIVAGRSYYVDQIDVNSFKVSTASGGAAITLGTATNLAYTKPWATTLTSDVINDLLQLGYDNGGFSEQATATLLCNSVQKRAITTPTPPRTAVHRDQPDRRRRQRHHRGDRLRQFNVMMDRHMPQDTIAAVSLEQLMPVFLNVPGKGVVLRGAAGQDRRQRRGPAVRRDRPEVRQREGARRDHRAEALMAATYERGAGGHVAERPARTRPTESGRTPGP
jgi:hypothetical protein